MPQREDDDAWIERVEMREIIRKTLNARQHQLLTVSQEARNVADRADAAWDDACNALREFDKMRSENPVPEDG